MNKDRRKEIGSIRTEVERLKDEVEELVSRITSVRDEEQESFENLPESLQNGTQGEASQSAIDHLGEAESSVDSTVSEFDNALASLEAAKE